MRTIAVALYKFDELSDGAKERARDWWREEGLDYEWWDGVYDDAKEMARILGIEAKDIYFSGFWSQGDGACFVGRYEYRKGSVIEIKGAAPKDEELHRIAEALYTAQRGAFFQLYATVTHRNTYAHEHSVDIDVLGERQQSVPSVAEEQVKDALRDFMCWIYARLEAEYDYLMSDDVVAKAIISNEYEFTENGHPH